MKRKLLCFVLCCLLFGLNSYAQQNGTVKGKVLTLDGKPAENISVRIIGTSLGASTNEYGEYKIGNVKPGTYTLKATAIGLQTHEESVTVTSKGTASANFTISANFAQLQEVNISTGKTNKFAAKKSTYVAKMPLNNLENPQVYTTITKELMVEQMVTNFNDALKNSSGLDKLWSSTGRPGDGAAYYSLRGFVVQPTLVNGIASLTNGDIDPAGIEKIEVIKGPSGTLYGGALTSYGGLINIVTKRPVDTLGGEVTYTRGNFNLNRLTADVYGPINKAKNLLARINTAYHYQNSFQDAGFRKTFYVAPSFEYHASEKLTLNLDAEFYHYEGTNPLMVFLNRSRALIARTPDELNFDFKRSYTANDITVKTPSTNIRGMANYKINDQWTSQTSFASSNRKSDGYYQYVMYLGATDYDLTRYAYYQNSTSNAIDLQQNFNGDFNIAGLRNRLLVGMDFLSQTTDNNNSPYLVFDPVLNSSKDVIDPKYFGLNKSALAARLGASTASPTKTSSTNNVYSVYLSDVLNITNQLSALVSFRVDRFQSRGTTNFLTNAKIGDYMQTSISPKFGVVYQVIKDQVSLFGNYMNSFRNIAPIVQPLADISGIFKPEHANQFEGGVKMNIFSNKLNFTASYYHITVENTTRGEQIDRDGTKYNITVQDGTQRSKGIEFDLAAAPISGLNMAAGYSYNDSRMTKSAASVLGRRPVQAGPVDLAYLWMSYTLKGSLKGLGAAFGGNYAGKNYITNSLATGEFVLPAYTTLNTTLFYSTKSYRVGLKIDNLTNKTYYKGWTTIEPQQPMSVLGNVTFKF